MFLKDVVSVMLVVINSASVLVILGGFFYAIGMFFYSIWKYGYQSIKCMNEMRHIRRQFGVYLLFALELLIAADLIQTVVNPSYQILIQLGGIVTIRTVITYFLEREIQQLKDSSK